MTHRRKLEFPHHHLFPFLEVQRACDSVDARRYAGHDRNLIRTGVDELRKGVSPGLMPDHPRLPRGALLMPAGNEVLESRLHGVRERPLGAAVEIDFALEDAEVRTNLLDLLVRQHEAFNLASAFSNWCTSSSVL